MPDQARKPAATSPTKNELSAPLGIFDAEQLFRKDYTIDRYRGRQGFWSTVSQDVTAPKGLSGGPDSTAVDLQKDKENMEGAQRGTYRKVVLSPSSHSHPATWLMEFLRKICEETGQGIEEGRYKNSEVSFGRDSISHGGVRQGPLGARRGSAPERQHASAEVLHAPSIPAPVLAFRATFRILQCFILESTGNIYAYRVSTNSNLPRTGT
ncbi:hypothetical protein EDD85DRAFT_786797 [Armillaria nabsnona]|nr:hypothetical protein EDD85DRAFT_786797 [Armillaria nabsnona]